MEILIIGGIVVALMAYVSTRIKKSAAAAYEKETIETEDFRLVKPQGFLHPLNVESEYAFEAYSKEFGEDGPAAKMRRSWAVVRAGGNDDGAQKSTAASGVIETEKEEKGVAVQTFRKVLQNGQTYELEVSVLKEFREHYLEKINEMMDSFTLKKL